MGDSVMARAKMIIVNGSKQKLRTVTKEMKGVLKQVVEYWHKELLPQHFKEGAARKYNYQPRSRNHIKRKRKKFGHAIPLVFSGHMSQSVMRPPRMTGNKKKATANLKGPRYLFQFRKDFVQPDKAAEIIAVSRRDEQRMDNFMNKIMIKMLRANKPTKVLKA